METNDTATQSALFLSAFFDELIQCGVKDVVVSPGSRSTPLSMIVYESDMRLTVDVDERGAAFFALGLAKASGKPVCLICTSGTAVANYFPAVLEAEISRVPLIVLSGDRPPRLQNLGAPQTCDQLGLFGRHVRHFQQMPLPGSHPSEIAFARQMALTAFSQAVGAQASEDDSGNAWYGCISDAGPVHFNFPFDEPLMPNMHAKGLFSEGRRKLIKQKTGAPLDIADQPGQGDDSDIYDALDFATLTPVITATSYPDASTIASIKGLLHHKCCLVLCGEGTWVNKAEVDMLLAWAELYHLPLIADPLSNLRSFTHPLIIDNYDNIFESEDCPEIDLVIRFGRYPVSKSCINALAEKRPFQIVVDFLETRDFSAATDVFVRCTPAAFVASCLYETAGEVSDGYHDPLLAHAEQELFAQAWVKRNSAETERIQKVSSIERNFEGAFVYRLIDLVPENSCIFSASSMAIRMLDTFYLKQEKRVSVLCNRGLNGIDGCVSSALGAAQSFEQTTFIVGDLALIHDLSALALQREIRLDRAESSVPSIIIVVMNNKGGGIFDMLPQQSEEAYFERLFLTPQEVNFSAIALGFGIPYACAPTVEDMDEAYRRFVGKPGIHLIEVPVLLEGLKERYGDFLA